MKDDNDRARAGLLPASPLDGTEPFEPPPESTPRVPAGRDKLADARAQWLRERVGNIDDDGWQDLVSWFDDRQKPDASERWTRVSSADMLAPLPPIPWVVKELELAPGAPTMIAGYGYSAKTISAQAMAVSVAFGLPVWGAWSGRAGRVVHIDHEQGRRLSVERYQRMMRALDVSPGGGALSLVVMPPTYLDSPGAEDVYCRELDGHVLAVIDSLRAAAPSADENDSDVRRTLDMLGRVSERTGCACVVIHHARKPHRDAMGGSKMEIRGSGALFDACQSVLVFSAEKGEPTIVSHEKARITGVTAPPCALRVVDVERDGDPRWGLRVVVGDAEGEAETRNTARLDSLCETVLDVVRGAPGSSGRAVQELAKARGWKGRNGEIAAVLDILARNGAVCTRPGARRTIEWWAAGPGGVTPWAK